MYVGNCLLVLGTHRCSECYFSWIQGEVELCFIGTCHDSSTQTRNRKCVHNALNKHISVVTHVAKSSSSTCDQWQDRNVSLSIKGQIWMSLLPLLLWCVLLSSYFLFGYFFAPFLSALKEGTVQSSSILCHCSSTHNVITILFFPYRLSACCSEWCTEFWY